MAKRIRRIAAALLTALFSVLCVASCAQGQELLLETESGGDGGDTSERVAETSEALTVIDCKGLGLDVVECMIRCALAKIPCTPRLQHPRKADAGDGDLFRCGQFGSKKTCAYAYSNGDACVVISGVAWIPCIYTGG